MDEDVIEIVKYKVFVTDREEIFYEFIGWVVFEDKDFIEILSNTVDDNNGHIIKKEAIISRQVLILSKKGSKELK